MRDKSKLVITFCKQKHLHARYRVKCQRNKAGGAGQSYLAVRGKCDVVPICMLARPVVTTMAMAATWQWRHYLLPCPVYVVAIWTLEHAAQYKYNTVHGKSDLCYTLRLNN